MKKEFYTQQHRPVVTKMKWAPKFPEGVMKALKSMTMSDSGQMTYSLIKDARNFIPIKPAQLYRQNTRSHIDPRI